jgi:glucose-1-phosphate cytidylyltransferase
MKTVILAGGFGTRLSEETSVRPKPMVEIGGMPIIWHIMKMYSYHGFNEFIICCGYKGYMIKEFFANYFTRMADVHIDLRNNKIELLSSQAEPWQITLVDTGSKTMTGGRLKRVRDYLDDETFFLTYGDGLSDNDFTKLLDFHKKQSVAATLTAVQPPGRFGAFTLHEDSNLIEQFREKPKGDSAWINGGFFVLEPEVFDYIEGDSTVFERGPLENLAKKKKLAAYKHDQYWQNMDSLRDKMVLEETWNSGSPPWKKWK